MTKFMDYLISPHPIRIIDLTVDKSRLQIKSLIISNAGHLPGRTLQRKNAEFQKWAIVYVTGGKGTYQINDGIKQIVEQGSLFFFYPNAVFNYGPEQNGYWDEYYFTIEGERVNEWIHNWQLQPEIVKQVGIDDAQQNKIDRIMLLLESGVPVNADRASLLLETMLYEFIHKANVLPESNRTQQIISIMEDLSNSLYQPIDVKKLAKRHHISLPTLRRVVSAYTGFPLNEYIHRLKASEAKKILLNSELPVKGISDALGYKDVFYFSRLFKKYVGVAPQTYRRNM
jgi:AraC family transcriptional regulator of arabinose operon